jgi:hypothetical protein
MYYYVDIYMYSNLITMVVEEGENVINLDDLSVNLK